MYLRMLTDSGQVLSVNDGATPEEGECIFKLDGVPVATVTLTMQLVASKHPVHIYWLGHCFSIYSNFKFTTFDGAGDYPTALEKLCQKLGYLSAETVK